MDAYRYTTPHLLVILHNTVSLSSTGNTASYCVQYSVVVNTWYYSTTLCPVLSSSNTGNTAIHGNTAPRCISNTGNTSPHCVQYSLIVSNTGNTAIHGIKYMVLQHHGVIVILVIHHLVMLPPIEL